MNKLMMVDPKMHQKQATQSSKQSLTSSASQRSLNEHRFQNQHFQESFYSEKIRHHSPKCCTHRADVKFFFQLKFNQNKFNQYLNQIKQCTEAKCPWKNINQIQKSIPSLINQKINKNKQKDNVKEYSRKNQNIKKNKKYFNRIKKINKKLFKYQNIVKLYSQYKTQQNLTNSKSIKIQSQKQYNNDESSMQICDQNRTSQCLSQAYYSVVDSQERVEQQWFEQDNKNKHQYTISQQKQLQKINSSHNKCKNSIQQKEQQSQILPLSSRLQKAHKQNKTIHFQQMRLQSQCQKYDYIENQQQNFQNIDQNQNKIPFNNSRQFQYSRIVSISTKKQDQRQLQVKFNNLQLELTCLKNDLQREKKKNLQIEYELVLANRQINALEAVKIFKKFFLQKQQSVQEKQLCFIKSQIQYRAILQSLLSWAYNLLKPSLIFQTNLLKEKEPQNAFKQNLKRLIIQYEKKTKDDAQKELMQIKQKFNTLKQNSSETIRLLQKKNQSYVQELIKLKKRIMNKQQKIQQPIQNMFKKKNLVKRESRQKEKFVEYQQIKQFNNLYSNRDQQILTLKEQIAKLKVIIKQYEHKMKGKKIIMNR